MAQKAAITRGQIFSAEGELILIEDYHFGADVVYEYATQMWLDQDGQRMMASALDLTDTTDLEAFAQLLKNRFLTFRAARQFADNHNIPYRQTTDMQP